MILMDKKERIQLEIAAREYVAALKKLRKERKRTMSLCKQYIKNLERMSQELKWIDAVLRVWV